ncbi:MAG: sigma 54-interacting transcriptional regulator [Hyphomonadaceae bacterium]|jgi:propionate catabolism operon transcriptional regulator|nr:sigma 54-interacting transcriptional regulator [Hyphomonadaceae bacterium]
MQLYRFAFVSNSAEIGKSVANCADPASEEVLLKYASMEAAIPVARRLLADGVDVIIGGGGTGALLAERIGAPVVNVARNPLDLLQALLRARKKTKDVAVTSYAKSLQGIDFYERLLAMRLFPVVFSTTEELETGIGEALNSGLRVVVGAGVCCQIARNHKAEGVIVVPRKDNVLQALHSARTIARARRAGQRESEIAASTVDSADAGLILLDERGLIGIMNEGAAKILRTLLPGVEPSTLIGQPLPPKLDTPGVIAALRSGRRREDAITTGDGVGYVGSVQPLLVDGVVVGAALSLRAPRVRQEKDDGRGRWAKGFVAKHSFDDVCGGPKMAAVIAQARRYAASGGAVLIEGATGTGKELVAQSIHNASARRQRPFVAVNCSALPESLLESELFGYEDGAFTGARRGGKAGLFELADRGTLFLDEIADISPNLQVRLLRALEEKEIMRIGGDCMIPLNVRIISSAQCDLFELARSNGFRLDLYFRLATLRLKIPPLRDRIEDAPLLLNVMLRKHGFREDVRSRDLGNAMGRYTWPGNVRELDGLVQTYAALSESAQFDEGLFLKLFEEMLLARAPSARSAAPTCPGATLKEQLRRHEEAIIKRTLRECGFDRGETARVLGISANSLWRKSKRRA